MDPPFVGVAVNMTEVPWQAGLAEVVIETLTGSCGLAVMMIRLEVSGLLVAHVSLEVRIQDTVSPFEGT